MVLLMSPAWFVRGSESRSLQRSGRIGAVGRVSDEADSAGGACTTRILTRMHELGMIRVSVWSIRVERVQRKSEERWGSTGCDDEQNERRWSMS
jgi:hypothetical protein